MGAGTLYSLGPRRLPSHGGWASFTFGAPMPPLIGVGACLAMGFIEAHIAWPSGPSSLWDYNELRRIDRGELSALGPLWPPALALGHSPL